MCGNRCVLFDNKTKDARKQSEQVQQLLTLVNRVTAQNGGQPFTDQLFTELKVKNAFANFGSVVCSLLFKNIALNLLFDCRWEP